MSETENLLSDLLRQISRALERGASPGHARALRRFFKEPIRAYGWRTAEVRQFAQRLRREMIAAGQREQLLPLATRLFARPHSEEWALGVFLLQGEVRRFGPVEFTRLEGWLPQLRNWADCDALSVYLLGPMIAADARYLPRVFRWARSRNRWHRRVAAASLVPAAGRRLYTREIFRLAERLLADEDDMVQKGVGWLLREAGKARHPGLVRFLLRVKRRAPRLVLRTACEKLPPPTRRRILD